VEYYDQALELDDARTADPVEKAHTLGNLALAWYDLGHPELAEEYEDAALALRREAGDQQGIALSLNNLVYRAMLEGNWPRASVFVDEAEGHIQSLGDQYILAGIWIMQASVAAQRRDFRLMNELQTAARELFDDSGAVIERASFEATLEEALATIQGQEDMAISILTTAVDALQSAGRETSLDQQFGILIALHQAVGNSPRHGS